VDCIREYEEYLNRNLTVDVAWGIRVVNDFVSREAVLTGITRFTGLSRNPVNPVNPVRQYCWIV